MDSDSPTSITHICLFLGLFVPLAMSVVLQTKVNYCCGLSAKEEEAERREEENEEREELIEVRSESADLLRKYKALLDEGAITQEEYEAQKKRILIV